MRHSIATLALLASGYAVAAPFDFGHSVDSPGGDLGLPDFNGNKDSAPFPVENGEDSSSSLLSIVLLGKSRTGDDGFSGEKKLTDVPSKKNFYLGPPKNGLSGSPIGGCDYQHDGDNTNPKSHGNDPKDSGKNMMPQYPEPSDNNGYGPQDNMGSYRTNSENPAQGTGPTGGQESKDFNPQYPRYGSNKRQEPYNPTQGTWPDEDFPPGGHGEQNTVDDDSYGSYRNDSQDDWFHNDPNQGIKEIDPLPPKQPNDHLGSGKPYQDDYQDKWQPESGRHEVDPHSWPGKHGYKKEPIYVPHNPWQPEPAPSPYKPWKPDHVPSTHHTWKPESNYVPRHS